MSLTGSSHRDIFKQAMAAVQERLTTDDGICIEFKKATNKDSYYIYVQNGGGYENNIYQANKIYWPNVGSMLAHRLQRSAKMSQHFVNVSCLLGIRFAQ